MTSVVKPTHTHNRSEKYYYQKNDCLYPKRQFLAINQKVEKRIVHYYVSTYMPRRVTINAKTSTNVNKEKRSWFSIHTC